MGPEHLALMIPIVALMIPISKIWTDHLRNIAEIKARQSPATALPADTRKEIEELKKQMAELRDTTTRFDMSFDAALTRLEERMDRLEQSQGVMPEITTTPASDQDRQTVQVRGK